MYSLPYANIPKFTGRPTYHVNCSWPYLSQMLKDFNIDINPDFQRAHVWTLEQQIAYIEYRLQGGMSGGDIFLNNPVRDCVSDRAKDVSVVVDGKQRITAALDFMEGKFRVFGWLGLGGGYLASEIEGVGRLGMETQFTLHINDLKTRVEVLRWYLGLNGGGIVHTPEELNRVRELLEAEKSLRRE